MGARCRDVVARVLGIATWGNFLVFVAIAQYFGGDAINGFSNEGHFFLSQKGHLTEVSETVFNYSRLHVIVLICNFAITMIFAWVTGKTNRSS